MEALALARYKVSEAEARIFMEMYFSMLITAFSMLAGRALGTLFLLLCNDYEEERRMANKDTASFLQTLL